MKRYRVLQMDFDTRAALFTMKIDGWSSTAIELHRQSLHQTRQEILAEYGTNDDEAKLRNFIDFGAKPLSVLAFHNAFFEQIRTAFIMGAYYPALTADCALGERILNHLILTLREDFKSTPQYKSIYKKDSFDDWEVAIATLESWQILLPEVAKSFRELKEVRNRAIHFNPATDRNARDIALEATGRMSNIIGDQFGAFRKQPWFIPVVPGGAFIKREWENKPFIKKIYLPNCRLVGPRHTIEFVQQNGGLVMDAQDDTKYEDREVSDEEFRDLIVSLKGSS